MLQQLKDWFYNDETTGISIPIPFQNNGSFTGNKSKIDQEAKHTDVEEV